MPNYIVVDEYGNPVEEPRNATGAGFAASFLPQQQQYLGQRYGYAPPMYGNPPYIAQPVYGAPPAYGAPPVYGAPAYGAPPMYGNPPYTAPGQPLININGTGIDLGTLISLITSGWAAFKTLPDPPAMTGDQKTDMERLTAYLTAGLQHVKSDEKLRFLGDGAALLLAGRLLGR